MCKGEGQREGDGGRREVMIKVERGWERIEEDDMGGERRGENGRVLLGGSEDGGGEERMIEDDRGWERMGEDDRG